LENGTRNPTVNLKENLSMNSIPTEKLYNPIYDSLSISEKQELLNNLELSNSSLDSLSESIVFEAEDRLTPDSDYRPEISS